jgi:hypothetical protein
MASQQRRRTSLRLDLSQSSLESPPAIAALFLIRFDIKKGYVSAPRSASVALHLSNRLIDMLFLGRNRSRAVSRICTCPNHVSEWLITIMHSGYRKRRRVQVAPIRSTQRPRRSRVRGGYAVTIGILF